MNEPGRRESVGTGLERAPNHLDGSLRHCVTDLSLPFVPTLRLINVRR